MSEQAVVEGADKFPAYPHLEALVKQVRQALDDFADHRQISIAESIGVLDLVKHQLLLEAFESDEEVPSE